MNELFIENIPIINNLTETMETLPTDLEPIIDNLVIIIEKLEELVTLQSILLSTIVAITITLVIYSTLKKFFY